MVNNVAAMIEGIYDIVVPEVPTAQHRWGRIVWLHDIEVGAKGKLLYFEDGVCKKTNLSTITNIIQTSNYFEIYTQSSIYKLRLISVPHDIEGKLSTELTNYPKEGIKLIRMPFRPPTDYYCEELAPIDEQICGLLAKRKALSNNNPGFPSIEFIFAWSQKFGLNEDWLRRIFAAYMLGEERLQPPVEPTGFLKFVPILKSVEIDNMTYAVTHMKQYTNASVVNVETEVNTTEPFVRLGHASFELFVSPEYQCRQSGGSGHGKGMQHYFIVRPALPDDVSEVEFRLRIKPLGQNPEFQEVPFIETTVKIK